MVPSLPGSESRPPILHDRSGGSRLDGLYLLAGDGFTCMATESSEGAAVAIGAPWKGVHGALLDNLCLSLGVCNPELPSWPLLLLMTSALSSCCKQEVPGRLTMVAHCCCHLSTMYLLQDREKALAGAICVAQRVCTQPCCPLMQAYLCLSLLTPTCALQEAEKALAAAVGTAQKRVHAALLDNLNTRGALDVLGELIRDVNKYLAEHKAGPGGAQPGEAVLCCCRTAWQQWCAQTILHC